MRCNESRLKVLLNDNEDSAEFRSASNHVNATAYVRPHELDIDRAPSQASLQGTIKQINPAGSVLKVRVAVEEFGVDLNIDVTHYRAKSLDLKLNDKVYVHPRSVRVFMPEPDYVI